MAALQDPMLFQLHILHKPYCSDSLGIGGASFLTDGGQGGLEKSTTAWVQASQG